MLAVPQRHPPPSSYACCQEMAECAPALLAPFRSLWCPCSDTDIIAPPLHSLHVPWCFDLPPQGRSCTPCFTPLLPYIPLSPPTSLHHSMTVGAFLFLHECIFCATHFTPIPPQSISPLHRVKPASPFLSFLLCSSVFSSTIEIDPFPSNPACAKQVYALQKVPATVGFVSCCVEAVRSVVISIKEAVLLVS